jgi:hydroxymethylbilane synthase
MAQATTVRDALVGVGIRAELDTIVTEGDRRPPDTAWGEGAFVGAIEEALIAGRIDVAVHSAKDVPTNEHRALTIAAFLPRADARDAIALPSGVGARSLDDLPAGARVGTDSPRRTAFLRAARPDIRLHPIHGNVDTRLRRLDDDETDALVLAAAGLERLGRGDRISLHLEPDVMPPAPGQGALAIQVRATDERVRHAVAALDDPPTRRAVELERAVLKATGGGCRAPVGVHAAPRNGELQVTAGYARPDGDLVASVSVKADGSDTSAAADRVILALVERATALARVAGWPRVIVTRPAAQAAATRLALVDVGITPLSIPAIDIELTPGDLLATAVVALDDVDWVVLTSSNGVRALRQAASQAGLDLAELAAAARTRWAAVGRATETALLREGIEVSARPATEDARGLAAALPSMAGARVLLPRGDLADGRLPRLLEGHGASVRTIVAYRTIEAPETSREPLDAALRDAAAGVVFSSPSTVRGLLELAEALGPDATGTLVSLPVVVVGATTAAAARGRGFTRVTEASSPAPRDVAEAMAGSLNMLEVPV